MAWKNSGAVFHGMENPAEAGQTVFHTVENPDVPMWGGICDGVYPWRQKNGTACLRGTRLLSRAGDRICAGREPRATSAHSADTQSQMRPDGGDHKPLERKGGMGDTLRA